MKTEQIYIEKQRRVKEQAEKRSDENVRKCKK